jgi:hypothetical protein
VVRDVLEPDVLRGTRPVLRGGSRSNAASLPDGEHLSHHAARLETDGDRASGDCSPSIRTGSDYGACCSLWHELGGLPIHDEFSLVLIGRSSPLRRVPVDSPVRAGRRRR